MKSPNYWKWGAIGAVMIAAFFLGRGCGISSVVKRTQSDTSISKRDTVIRYKPSPYKVTEVDTQFIKKYIKSAPIHDTLPGTYEVYVESVDTAAILKDFLQIAKLYGSKKFYDTSFMTGGMDTVRLMDTVWMNNITGRSITIMDRDTTIKTVVTNTPPNKFAVTLDGHLMGNFMNPFHAQGVGATLVTPKNNTYSVAVFNVTGHRPMFMIKRGWVIRFNKKTK